MRNLVLGIVAGVVLCVTAQTAYAVYETIKFMDRTMGKIK